VSTATLDTIRHIRTGLHTVADLFCTSCDASLGWTYLKAQDRDQVYKEGESESLGYGFLPSGFPFPFENQGEKRERRSEKGEGRSGYLDWPAVSRHVVDDILLSMDLIIIIIIIVIIVITTIIVIIDADAYDANADADVDVDIGFDIHIQKNLDGDYMTAR
jgi:hypothetical protein